MYHKALCKILLIPGIPTGIIGLMTETGGDMKRGASISNFFFLTSGMKQE